MTDKQIIIDGHDVSKCGYLCCGKICSWFNDDCKNYDICYYKQLKRKELILEKIKEKYKNVCKVCPKNIKCNECSVKDTLDMLKKNKRQNND